MHFLYPTPSSFPTSSNTSSPKYSPVDYDMSDVSSDDDMEGGELVGIETDSKE